nr:hypothetical protein [Tanacetum cinerariifolium]
MALIEWKYDQDISWYQGLFGSKEEWKIGYNNNSTNHNGVKIGGQSVKPNIKYVPKASSHPSKASELPSSSSGNLNGKNDGTNAKEKVMSPYNSSNIPVSSPYALLDEESDEEVEFF